jgi:protein-L-isoaspartate(D-aspartate) O-methyltransferase
MAQWAILACLCIFLVGCSAGPSITPEASSATISPATETPESSSILATPSRDSFDQVRNAMVLDTIEDRGVTNPDVLRAMRGVPRHLFVPPEYIVQAYADHPLPIGYGQTISQPYVVAWMTELLDLKPGDKVLEIGTGSGYQAAVLAELGFVDVYSIEIVPELAQSAADRLKDLGYRDVHVKQGDGYYGWQEFAPFDAIIVTAAPDHLPAPLVEQLAPGGRIVVPIGPPGGFQSLWKFSEENGELVADNMGGVSFVPFTGPGIQQALPTKTP